MRVLFETKSRTNDYEFLKSEPSTVSPHTTNSAPTGRARCVWPSTGHQPNSPHRLSPSTVAGFCPPAKVCGKDFVSSYPLVASDIFTIFLLLQETLGPAKHPHTPQNADNFLLTCFFTLICASKTAPHSLNRLTKYVVFLMALLELFIYRWSSKSDHQEETFWDRVFFWALQCFGWLPFLRPSCGRMPSPPPP